MYAMVMNVVSPARTSVRTEVFRSFNANNRSNMVPLLNIKNSTPLL